MRYTDSDPVYGAILLLHLDLFHPVAGLWALPYLNSGCIWGRSTVLILLSNLRLSCLRLLRQYDLNDLEQAGQHEIIHYHDRALEVGTALLSFQFLPKTLPAYLLAEGQVLHIQMQEVHPTIFDNQTPGHAVNLRPRSHHQSRPSYCWDS